MQHLFPKYHKKQVRTFIPQPVRARLQHPWHRHIVWGTKRFSSLLQHNDEQWLPPTLSWPWGSLPHTPTYLAFLCCVCLYSLILILRTLIYTFENQNHLKSSWLRLLLEHVHKYVVWIFFTAINFSIYNPDLPLGVVNWITSLLAKLYFN